MESSSSSALPALTDSTSLTPVAMEHKTPARILEFVDSTPDHHPPSFHDSQHSSDDGGGSRSKFSSRELRGNLTRRQLNRNPLKYYEIVNILGAGSMGSVTMVRKRSSAVGGSARKSVQDEVRRENQLQKCFQLPIVGHFFQYCFHGVGSLAKSSNSTGSPDGDSIRTNDWVMKQASGDDASSENRSDAIIYAMKSIHLSRCTDSDFVEELKNEIEILKTLDHPHIVKAIETFDFNYQLFVVMELCSGGDLYRRDPYTEDEAARITSAILSAISYMHSKNMYVRTLFDGRADTLLLSKASHLSMAVYIVISSTKIFYLSTKVPWPK
jgi:serine/threonine protein kinase